MYFKIVASPDNMYDVYREDYQILNKVSTLETCNFIVKNIRDTDIVDFIMVDGNKSSWTLSMLKAKAQLVIDGKETELSGKSKNKRIYYAVYTIQDVKKDDGILNETEVGKLIDLLLKYCRDARWDIVSDAMRKLDEKIYSGVR